MTVQQFLNRVQIHVLYYANYSAVLELQFHISIIKLELLYKTTLTVAKVETINHTNRQNCRLVRQSEQSICYLAGFKLIYCDSGNTFFISLGEVFAPSQKMMIKYGIVSFT